MQDNLTKNNNQNNTINSTHNNNNNNKKLVKLVKDNLLVISDDENRFNDTSNEYEPTSTSTSINGRNLERIPTESAILQSQSSSQRALKLSKSSASIKKFTRRFQTKIPLHDEQLVKEFSCALLRNNAHLLIHGTLYVTRKYYAFYSNLFGFETSLQGLWRDVCEIKKENIAILFPTAIRITTKNNEKIIFASFISRNQAYDCLYELWSSNNQLSYDCNINGSNKIRNSDCNNTNNEIDVNNNNINVNNLNLQLNTTTTTTTSTNTTTASSLSGSMSSLSTTNSIDIQALTTAITTTTTTASTQQQQVPVNKRLDQTTKRNRSKKESNEIVDDTNNNDKLNDGNNNNSNKKLAKAHNKQQQIKRSKSTLTSINNTTTTENSNYSITNNSSNHSANDNNNYKLFVLIGTNIYKFIAKLKLFFYLLMSLIYNGNNNNNNNGVYFDRVNKSISTSDHLLALQSTGNNISRCGSNETIQRSPSNNIMSNAARTSVNTTTTSTTTTDTATSTSTSTPSPSSSSSNTTVNYSLIVVILFVIISILYLYVFIILKQINQIEEKLMRIYAKLQF